MDYREATTARVLDDSAVAHKRALEQVLDRFAIQDLVSLYSIARDDNDLDRLVDFFAGDGAFVVGADRMSGHAQLREFYLKNMTRYRTTLHVTHSQIITFMDSEHAAGIVTGHAELAFGDSLMMAAYRYTDTYVKSAERWMFAERVLRFMYSIPFEDMATSFRTPLRMRWPDQAPTVAEIPESIPTYREVRRRLDSKE